MRASSTLTVVLLALALAASSPAARASEADCLVGVARVDITPDHPVRLSGYGGRRAESEGVEQRLWAKALALGSDAQGPVLLVMLETCVLPAWMTDEVFKRVHAKTGIARERFTLCCTHTHSAPFLPGALPTLFGEPIPAEHQARIDRHAARLLDQLEGVSLAALADRKPGRLAWGQGKVGFAMNRRVVSSGRPVQMRPNPDSPVDHAMPLLRATDFDGKLRAVMVNYACHCTTLGGDYNKICGDWAGYAQEYVEADHPGSTCLVLIGCGADANPDPRLKLEHAQQQGRAIAAEVQRLLEGPLVPVAGPPTCRFAQIKLPFDRIPDRAEWEKRAQRDDAAGYQARLQVARLDRGETLATELPYPVQTWTFGDRLAMVFLGGEVVVDYALRIKQEFDAGRLWVTAYANDVPCYIASRRVLAEGGYEADTSMIYYDQPTRLAPAVEDLILSAVHAQLPAAFRSGRGEPQRENAAQP